MTSPVPSAPRTCRILPSSRRKAPWTKLSRSTTRRCRKPLQTGGRRSAGRGVGRLRSPCGGGGRDVTGRNENFSEATGTASRLRRRAGRRQKARWDRAGFEASPEGPRKGAPTAGDPSEGAVQGDLPCEET